MMHLYFLLYILFQFCQCSQTAQVRASYQMFGCRQHIEVKKCYRCLWESLFLLMSVWYVYILYFTRAITTLKYQIMIQWRLPLLKYKKKNSRALWKFWTITIIKQIYSFLCQLTGLKFISLAPPLIGMFLALLTFFITLMNGTRLQIGYHEAVLLVIGLLAIGRKPYLQCSMLWYIYYNQDCTIVA